MALCGLGRTRNPLCVLSPLRPSFPAFHQQKWSPIQNLSFDRTRHVVKPTRWTEKWRTSQFLRSYSEMKKKSNEKPFFFDATTELEELLKRNDVPFIKVNGDFLIESEHAEKALGVFRRKEKLKLHSLRYWKRFEEEKTFLEIPHRDGFATVPEALEKIREMEKKGLELISLNVQPQDFVFQFD